MQRYLAAILAADVVEYSRLMGEDAQGTLALLKELRSDVLEPAFSGHRGAIIKRMGDGWLVEFSSAVDAIGCAIDIQERLAGHADIRLRIGVHIGDVTHEEEDIYGDGVNIAARLQAAADPGGIVISEFARRSIDDKLASAFVDLGVLKLKNISRPVTAFGWGMAKPAEAPALPMPAKPSIAVLPFDNMSGDPQQDYFSDGMTEDIITDLSKASGLFVIARNSSFAYKGKSPDIRQVSRELGVKYILEGSIRRAGKRVRINAQLIDGTNGGHVWAERYDRDLEDIFVVQDDVTREIVAALKVNLTAPEAARLEGKTKANPEANDYLYRGRALMLEFRPESLLESRRMLQRSIDLDPGLAQSYANLAIAYYIDRQNGWNGAGDAERDRALELARKAVSLDANDITGFVALALCQLWNGTLEEAEKTARQAIRVNPNSANGYAVLGNCLDYCGRHKEAAEHLRQAFRLDPQQDFFLSQLGRALFAMGEDEEAEASFKSRLVRNPGSDTTRAYLAALYGIQGRTEEARELWREVKKINPDYDPQLARTTLPYKDSSFFDRFYSGLAKAELLD